MREAEGVPLPGGRMTSGLVRYGDRVRRPTGLWSPTVHEYLRHLAAAGFEGSPRVLATGDGWEELTYIEGEVAADKLEFLAGELRWIHRISAGVARAL
jgi:hypothetical protein